MFSLCDSNLYLQINTNQNIYRNLSTNVKIDPIPSLANKNQDKKLYQMFLNINKLKHLRKLTCQVSIPTMAKHETIKFSVKPLFI